jgi:thioredoxin:protein disulfide reductase
VDGTNDHSLLDELYARFEVKGLPTVVFIDPLGKELKEPRITGFKAAGDFVGDMQRVAVATSCAH